MEGKCHICGTNGKLSFEHIPPKKAFNNARIFQQQLEEFINKPPFDYSGGKVSQRGLGDYTLCERCNSLTGKWYGAAYVNWAIQGFRMIDLVNHSPALYFPVFIYPLRVIKEIISIFFSVNNEDFRKAKPYLQEFVLKKEKKYLPEGIRIYLFYTLSNLYRKVGVSASLRMNNRISAFSEFTFPPYGYVLSIDSLPPDDRLYDITYFSKFDYMELRNLYIKPPLLPIVTWMPGDYRKREAVEAAYRKNIMDDLKRQKARQR